MTRSFPLVCTVGVLQGKYFVYNSRPSQQESGCVVCVDTGFYKQKKMFSVKMYIFSYPSVKTYVLGAHNICFGLETRKLNFRYGLLTKVLC